VPSPATVTVQATSVASPSAVGTASVTIKYPAPAISSVTPNQVTSGSSFTLTVNGSSFRSGAVVKLNGAALTTTFVGTSQLTATGSTSQTGNAVPVTVANPDGQVSGAYNISVIAGGPISVSVAPSSATVRTRRTQQFTATVQNASDPSVTWKVNGVTGGNSTVGTISTGGLYTAPASVPGGGTVTVSAVSVADATKSGTATVTITRH
jgi:IPT/TIG domain